MARRKADDEDALSFFAPEPTLLSPEQRPRDAGALETYFDSEQRRAAQASPPAPPPPLAPRRLAISPRALAAFVAVPLIVLAAVGLPRLFGARATTVPDAAVEEIAALRPAAPSAMPRRAPEVGRVAAPSAVTATPAAVTAARAVVPARVERSTPLPINQPLLSSTAGAAALTARPTPRAAPPLATATAPPPTSVPPRVAAGPPANAPISAPPAVAEPAPVPPPAAVPTAGVEPPAVTRLPPPVTATAAIEGVLSRYADAFNSLDASQAKRVWPAVDERALARAFDQLEEQDVELGRCTIDVKDASAVARCGGTSRYVPKVGSKNARTEARQWTFRLRQGGEQWSIEAVEAR